MAKNLGPASRARSISPGTQQKIIGGIKGENPLKNVRPNYENTQL